MSSSAIFFTFEKRRCCFSSRQTMLNNNKFEKKEESRATFSHFFHLYIVNCDWEMDDSQLIISCKKQNRSAQKALYERYAPVMMAVCLRYCRDEELARDLLHDGFLQVFTQIGSYTGKGSFEGWLRRIFVNIALDNYRKEKKKFQFLEEYTYLSSSEADSLADEPLDIENIPRSHVLNLIQELPEGQRTVFNLYIFEEMSHKEIAHALGINEAASRSQFFRAKSLLQKKIKAILRKE